MRAYRVVELYQLIFVYCEFVSFFGDDSAGSFKVVISLSKPSTVAGCCSLAGSCGGTGQRCGVVTGIGLLLQAVRVRAKIKGVKFDRYLFIVIQRLALDCVLEVDEVILCISLLLQVV